MSDDIPEVIGEGTYGCVHNPPLLCKDSKERDLMNVSKLMATNEAASEMKEYVLINNIDKNKDYYLGQPKQCLLGKTKSNKRAIRSCHISEDVFEEYSKYSLLIMKNGGLNLGQYAKKMGKEVVNSENKQKVEDFWLETHRLMMGLKLFHDNGVVHHDMKSGNIVYLEKDNRLNFIDFGLLCKKTDLIKNNRKNDNWLAIAHWSFPLELQYLTNENFKGMSQKSESDKTKMFVDIAQRNDAIKTFVSVINKKTTIFKLKPISKFFEDYLLTLKDIDTYEKYEEFMDHSINTIDSYGVASGLMEVLCSVYNFMDMDFVYELADLLYKMFTPHQRSRLDINGVLLLYEDCLERHILKKRKLQFSEHKIVKESKIETVFNKKLGSIKLKDVIITSNKKLSKLATSPRCPEGKEFNPFTRKCIKNCKNGYVRDRNFKCIRKPLTKLDCPEGKILNPKTNRCIKVKNTRKILKRLECPEGKILNPKTNRCIKLKNTRKTLKRLECPEGKILNPKTNRCIKVKTEKTLRQKN